MYCFFFRLVFFLLNGERYDWPLFSFSFTFSKLVTEWEVVTGLQIGLFLAYLTSIYFPDVFFYTGDDESTAALWNGVLQSINGAIYVSPVLDPLVARCPAEKFSEIQG